MSKNLDMASARASLGLTQARLAELLDVDRKYVSMIETGTKPLSAKMSKKLDMLLRGVSNSTAPPGVSVSGGAVKPIGAAVGEYSAAHGFRQEIDDIRERLSTIERLLVKLTSQR